MPYGCRLFTSAVATPSSQLSLPSLTLHSQEVLQLSLITDLSARRTNWLTRGPTFVSPMFFISSAFVRSEKPKMFKGLQIKVGVMNCGDVAAR